MSKHAGEESHNVPKPDAKPFFDCLAYQLAKRWLSDQQQEQEAKPLSKQSQKPFDELSE
ncbi:MAG: hypothetical protein GX594_18970 [Pirellulaceae bacterium]|nr:hypothetical protein [Pirellulaceae bacterium]